MSKRGEADPWDRPPKIYEGTLQNLHLSESIWRPIPAIGQNLSSPHVLLVFNVDLLGGGFTSADELGRIDIGPTEADVQIQCLG